MALRHLSVAPQADCERRGRRSPGAGDGTIRGLRADLVTDPSPARRRTRSEHATDPSPARRRTRSEHATDPSPARRRTRSEHAIGKTEAGMTRECDRKVRRDALRPKGRSRAEQGRRQDSRPRVRRKAEGGKGVRGEGGTRPAPRSGRRLLAAADRARSARGNRPRKRPK